jgi:hypothetical protein
MCCVSLGRQCTDDSECCYGVCVGRPDGGATCG